MVLHSRDPALLFPDENKKPVNKCLHVLPGSCDCQNQVSKNVCVFQKENASSAARCVGRTGDVGADIKKGQQFVAIKRLEEYQSTGKGRGHLSDLRAAHSDTVPFSEKTLIIH